MNSDSARCQCHSIDGKQADELLVNATNITATYGSDCKCKHDDSGNNSGRAWHDDADET
jgi:beta-xylosidase